MRLPRIFRKRHAAEATTEVLDLGPDPLDPHGDGTIRPGDPMFDLMMKGTFVYGNRRPDGKWDVESLDED